MQRLLKFLLSIDDQNVTQYRRIYEDDMEILGKKTNATRKEALINRYGIFGPTYWHGDCPVTLAPTHRTLLQMPLIEIRIPLSRLMLEEEAPAYTRAERLAAADFFLRTLAEEADAANESYRSRTKPPEESGMFYPLAPGQRVEEVSCARMLDGELLLVLQALLPVYRSKEKKVTINGKKAAAIMTRDLPDLIDRIIDRYDIAALWKALRLARKQAELRAEMARRGILCFVANGSLLPRRNAGDLPAEYAVPFLSPPSFEEALPTEEGEVRGMAVRPGVTVITGGGYSGKTTLLSAMASGVYNHVGGDGRELVLTDESAFSIAAEDGRSVQDADLSPFIHWPAKKASSPPGAGSPQEEDSAHFHTPRASGSTSQAANIMESVAFGTRLLLIDEDKSATNFMIRDRCMRMLIKKEPIIPFTDRVNSLARDAGVSTVLVIGGSGEYLRVADRILLMEDFLASDATERAKTLAEDIPLPDAPPPPALWKSGKKYALREGFTPYRYSALSQTRGEWVKQSVSGFISIGEEDIDLRPLFSVLSKEQAAALLLMLRHIELSAKEERIDLEGAIGQAFALAREKGLSFFLSQPDPSVSPYLAMPRPIDLWSVVQRMRRAALFRKE